MSISKQSEKTWEFIFFGLFLVLISVFILKTLDGGILFWDDGFYPFNPVLALNRELSAWNGPIIPGYPFDGGVLYLPFIIFTTVLRFFSFGYSIIDAVYLIILLFLGGIGTYLLSKFITVNYIFKDHTSGFNLYLGSALASLYFVFNYEQMVYYGGEFYSGFLMVNLTPILLYLILLYLSSSVKFGFWNRYLGLISIVSVIIAGGIDITGSMGGGIQWFSAMIIFTILAGRFLENKIVSKSHFISKMFSVLLIIILSSAWVFPYVYFNLAAIREYATSAYLYGKPLIVAGGYGTIFQNIYALFTSGFGNYPSFVQSGPYHIWYAPLALVNSNIVLIGFTYIPFIISLLYIFFINKKWLNKGNLLSLFFVEIFFISLLVQVINTRPLSYSSNPIISGFNFFLQPNWSIYPFVAMVSIFMGISLNIVQRHLLALKKMDLQTVIIPKTNKLLGLIPIISRLFWVLGRHIRLPKTARMYLRMKEKVIKRPRKGRLYFYGTILSLIILIVLFISPILINPLQAYQYGNSSPVQGVFKVDNSFNDVGTFLSRESPYNNVLYLPVTISPSAGMNGQSSFMTVLPPFSPYMGGEMLSQDPGPSNASWIFPILANFPNISHEYFSNFLSLLSIKYIVVNTKEYPTWVNQTNFAESGPPWNFKSMLNALNESTGINFVLKIGPYYIYEVKKALPMVYPTYMVPSKNYSQLTPESVYGAFANGSLIAGETSIINSTIIYSGLNQYNTPYWVYSSYLQSSVKCFPIYIKHTSEVNSGIVYYNQLLVIKNYSSYGINTNVSNIYFEQNNGSYINAWIQFHNATMVVIWTKIPINTSKISMCVLPKNIDILSSNGFIGVGNSSFDNIARVFSQYNVNYHLKSPFNDSTAMQVLFSNSTSYWNDYYQGFGFTIANMGKMNFSDDPFFQLNSPNNWNPAFQFYSANNGTGYVYGIQGNTTVPYYDLKFGYLYVYNVNSSSQNTIQSINGNYNTLYKGDNGIFSDQFVVDGSRTINVTFADAFQFYVPIGGMPNISIGTIPTIVYPLNSTINGPGNTGTNQSNIYFINFTKDAKPVNSSYVEYILSKSKIVLVNDTSGLNTTVNGYLDKNSIEFSPIFNNAGEYTVLFESNINGTTIAGMKNIQVESKNKPSNTIMLNITGPQEILPGKNYTYEIDVEYLNGTHVNLSLTSDIFNNLTVNLLGQSTQTSSNKLMFTGGKIYINVREGNSGLIKLQAHSWIYSFRPLPTLNFSRISDSEYLVHINAGSSFYLNLNQAFDSGWVATINGKSITNHYLANDFANSWYMPAGNYTALIYFEPQHYQNIAFGISISTLSFLTSLTIFDFFFYRKFPPNKEQY